MSQQIARATSTVSTSSISTESDGDDVRCPECSGAISQEKTDHYCRDCGIIVAEEAIERSIPSWTNKDSRHWGPGSSQQWLQQGTCVGYSSDSTSAEVPRFCRYNTRLKSSEQSLHRGLRELRGTCEELEVGRFVRERAAKLFRDAVLDGLLQGRSIEAFAGAAIFVALREISYPITFGWLAEMTLANESEISDAYRQLLSTFELRVLPPEPEDFLPCIASRLDVCPKVERTAALILERAREAGLSNGKHPAGFAGAAIYIAVQQWNIELLQSDVANAADVSVVTISRRSTDIDNEDIVI